MSLKKVVIFGASGQIGLKSTDAALKSGLAVRVLLRDPTAFPEELKSKVEVIKGDVRNAEDVNKAVKGQDGVIVTLGTRTDLGPTTAMSEGMKNIVNAMRLSGVDLVSVCISAFLFYEPEKVPAIFKDVTADHLRMFNILEKSELKWIAVFPPHFTDDPSGKYIIKHGGSPGRSISKQDLGAFLLESLSNPEHYNKVCGIAQEKIEVPV